MRRIKTLHCFNAYLHTTENWMLRLISSLPDTEVYIGAKEFLRENFYSDAFRYCNSPVQRVDVPWKEKTPIWLKALNRVSRSLNGLYPAYLGFLLKDTGIELLHSHYGFVGWEYRAVAARLKIPHVVSFYGFDYERVPYLDPRWNGRYKELFADVQLLVSEGPHGARILQRLGCPPEKIFIGRLGVYPETIRMRKRVKRQKELTLVQIASMLPKKGHEYTVQAFAAALKKCPNMRLTLVGKGEPVKAEIIALVATLGIRDRVQMLDGIEYSKLYDFLGEFDVFIQPSCYTDERDCEGGAPVVLLDAQATGMPVIATTHCDIPDEVVDGESGFLSPEKDVEGLSASIERFYLMQNREYARMATFARRHVENQYDIRKNASALRQQYTRLLESTR